MKQHGIMLDFQERPSKNEREKPLCVMRKAVGQIPASMQASDANIVKTLQK